MSCKEQFREIPVHILCLACGYKGMSLVKFVSNGSTAYDPFVVNDAENEYLIHTCPKCDESGIMGTYTKVPDPVNKGAWLVKSKDSFVPKLDEKKWLKSIWKPFWKAKDAMTGSKPMSKEEWIKMANEHLNINPKDVDLEMKRKIKDTIYDRIVKHQLPAFKEVQELASYRPVRFNELQPGYPAVVYISEDFQRLREAGRGLVIISDYKSYVPSRGKYNLTSEIRARLFSTEERYMKRITDLGNWICNNRSKVSNEEIKAATMKYNKLQKDMKKAVDSSYAIWKWLAEAPVKWSDDAAVEGWTSWKEKKSVDRARMLRRKSERLASRGKEDKAMECLDGARGELFQLSILQKEEVEEKQLEKCSGTCKDINLYYKGRLEYEFDVLGEEVPKHEKIDPPMWNYTCGSGWFHMEDVVSDTEWDYYYKR